jgi:hypothetical protein
MRLRTMQKALVEQRLKLTWALSLRVLGKGKATPVPAKSALFWHSI